MLVLELGRLDAGAHIHLGDLNDPRPGEAHSRLRLGDVHVAQHREARRDAAVGGIGEYADIRQAGLAVTKRAYSLYQERGYEAVLLVAALRGGRLGAAGLDVFASEPLPPRHPLTLLDNVVLTPHCAGITPEALEAYRQNSGRIDIVTRTNSYQVRTGDYSNDVISVYLILRRYWGDRPREPMEQMFVSMAERAEQLCHNYILPRVVKPISAAIASRS